MKVSVTTEELMPKEIKKVEKQSYAIFDAIKRMVGCAKSGESTAEAEKEVIDLAKNLIANVDSIIQPRSEKEFNEKESLVKIECLHEASKKDGQLPKI
jgi:hypothetical protein